MRISDWSSDVCSSDLFAHDQRGDAARAVAAGADLAAVVVADAQEDIGAAVGRPLENQQLVAADTLAAVGDGTGLRVRQWKRLLARVDHDEVVAEPVHLDAGATAHGRVIWPRGVDSPGTSGDRREGEIGRASGREGGGQYVE